MSDKPRNLKDFHILELEEINVVEYHPLPDGEGSPTEVHIHLTPKGQPNARLVVRFKGRDTLDRVVAALQKHADSVFGSLN